MCPHRIIDDLGSGFGLGLLIGSMINFVKGVYSSPAKERIWGGLMLAKRRAPITGGNFAAWMGLFGFWQCSLLYLTGKDTHTNQILAGAITGGMVNLRGGWKYAQRGFFSGAVFIGVFNLIEILTSKRMFRQEVLRKQIEMRYHTLNEVNKYRKLRPDYIPVSDEEFDVMKQKLNHDIEEYGFKEIYGKV